ncbi:tetraacyldisaccharide 4'-kinase [Pedobacter sp. P351]|uniref:tetraacyldisaccharide 4'-kinase n=1 Tax=Pedobacter superstes TaxID=3133441 RepID=UPI00309737D2
MQYLRLLLLPFSLVYGCVIWIRNFLYDTGVFASKKFNNPVICIGNLVIGGAGKSPMAEYIIRVLKEKHKIAVLSRGYKRETRGFRIVDVEDTVSEVGDEPLQFKRKFKDITVAVAEKRVEGIQFLKENHEVIILDDAFQHRAVTPGLTVLLFDYTKVNDFLIMLPAGNLREPFANRKRADIMVISKCPDDLSILEKERIKNRIKPFKHQNLFFSSLDYGNLISLASADEKPLSVITSQTSVFLLTGIANPDPLLKKVKSLTEHVIHYDYPDHHTFSSKNIIKLAEEFNSSAFSEKLILTTEKDAQRLQLPELLALLKNLPVYYLPVTARFHQPDDERFNNLIELYVTRDIQHNSVH